jgi:two-component system, sporulation sensor kinase A
MLTSHPLNNWLNTPTALKNGAHILYMYNEWEKYIEIACEYIHNGLINGAIVVFMESDEIITTIKKRLEPFPNIEKNLICIKANEFYLKDNEMDAQKLNTLLQPYLKKGISVRTWGNVPPPNNKTMLESIRQYECDCDSFISSENIISLCSYNALITPSYVQNELLKTHTHIMTDDTYSHSPFYNQINHKFLTNSELEKLHRIEEQYQSLLEKNNQLAIENKLIKLKNDTIKQSEQKLLTIINELPIPIIIKNRKEILFYNSEAQQMLLNSNQVSLLESYFKENENKFISRQLLDQLFILDNPKRYYLVYSINLHYGEGVAKLHPFVDITQQKENERLIIRSEKKTIAGELAASIAHELRNPLTAVKGFFHIIKNTNEKKDLYFTIIDDELSRIEQIASELLTLAKPHSDNRKKYNLIQLVEEVKLLLISQTNMKNIEIILEKNNEETIINCDKNKIKQVFINLIKNAIDAMNNGGKIFINIHESNDYVQIEIVDQGKGISKDVLNKIGEPFYTTKSKGTGIGLMICFQIIESHQGTINVTSELDVGTTFTISLPKTLY